jgi:DNA-binding CsgD family transcriptional regulator
MMHSVNQKIILPKKIESIYRRNSIRPLCASLFSQVQLINYFDYQHYYDDGRVFTTCTHPEYIKHYYAEGVYITINEMEKLRQSYGSPKKMNGFFCKEIAMTDSLELKNKGRLNIALGEQFNIEKRFYLAKREKNYIELVGIGTNQVEKMQDFMLLCLENLQIFNAFIDYFKDVGRGIINTFKGEMITSPYKLECKQENKQLKHHNFKTGNNFSLSSREYECLESMALGRPMKETAHLLNLSPRTIEAHMNNIKIKTGFYAKSQLVSFFQSLR